ncbi:MAG: hypothetical protein IPK53_03875 [bacterium]|nr:hypothetical protein [bacterium]
MPNMGGLDLLRALRQQGNHIPLILLTGHAIQRYNGSETTRGKGYLVQTTWDTPAWRKRWPKRSLTDYW